MEHGSFATEQTFALMKAHGTYLVPTLTVYDAYGTDIGEGDHAIESGLLVGAG